MIINYIYVVKMKNRDAELVIATYKEARKFFGNKGFELKFFILDNEIK